MGEERRKVLEMLAEGKLTPEQANQFLEAMGARGATGEDTASGVGPMAPASVADGALDPDLVIDLVTVGGDVQYVRQLRDLGLLDLPPDLLRSLTAVTHDPEYIRDVRDRGLLDLPHDLLVSLSAVKHDAAYIQCLRDMGLLNLPQEVLVRLTAVVGDADKIRELRDSGLMDLTGYNSEEPADRAEALA